MSTVPELQARFAIAFANNGGKATEAAIEAGYSEKSAKDLGRRAFETPHVQELIMLELNRLRSRAGAVGMAAVVEVAQSDKAPAAAKVPPAAPSSNLLECLARQKTLATRSAAARMARRRQIIGRSSMRLPTFPLWLSRRREKQSSEGVKGSWVSDEC